MAHEPINPRAAMEKTAAPYGPSKYNKGDVVTVYRRDYDGRGQIQPEQMRVVEKDYWKKDSTWRYFLERVDAPGMGEYYLSGSGRYDIALQEEYVYPQSELFEFQPSQQAREYQVYMAPQHMKPKGPVSPRDAMNHFAAYPPVKIGPPKDHFPGDTVPNDDGHGGSSMAGGEPFGRGLEAPPGARGELVPGRPPGSSGVPMNPVSPSQSVDDSERKKQVPPIYRTTAFFQHTAEVETPRKGEIPPPILAAWNNAHNAMQDLYPEYTLEQLDRVLEATAIFAARSKPFLAEQTVATLGQRFRTLDEHLLSSGGNMSAMARESFAGKIDAVLQLVHEAIAKALKIHQMDWYDKRGAEQGGVFDTHEPASIGDITPKVRYQCASTEKTAFDVSPVPKTKGNPKKTNDPMVLSLPRDVRERYAALARRVQDYARSVGPHLGALDAYKYRSSPPRDWVERELPNAKADWEDLGAWGRYVSRKDHHELSDWALKEADFSKVSPTLYTQWAVSSSTQQDFGKWFRRQKPSIRKDESLVTYLRDHARSDPDHEISRGYDSWWRKRYLGKVYGQAYKLAKEKWTEYLKTSGTEFAKDEYRDALGLVQKAANGERVPVGDLVAALQTLPFENEYRADVEGYKSELDTIVNEGRTALDVAHQPVSREDRLFGDLVHEGNRWIPARRVEGVEKAETPAASTGPIRVFAYGSRYFPIDEATEKRVATELALGTMYLEADVTRIIPGSSIAKQHVASIEDFNAKSKALSEAIYDIQAGQDREAVFMKYGRVFGPGLRKALDDYFYIQSMNRDADTDAVGDQTGGGCDTFWEGQTADNCEGCTFNVGTGGPEFGYGGCWLSHLFLNAPDAGFGKGDQPVGYDPGHTPGTPTEQKRPTNYRLHRS